MRTWSHTLGRSGVIASALVSALAVGLLAARMAVPGPPHFGYLLWNLALAWVPLGALVGVAALDRTRWEPVVALPRRFRWRRCGSRSSRTPRT